MRIRSYEETDYDSVRKLLTLCDLFDKSYDMPKKFARKKPKGSIFTRVHADNKEA